MPARLALTSCLVLLSACSRKTEPAPSEGTSAPAPRAPEARPAAPAPTPPAAPAGAAGDDAIESKDILARQPVTQKAEVKHVLIGWSDLGPNYRGSQDPRGAARTRADADALAQKVLARLRGGEPVDAVMKELSEDPGSAQTGKAYPVDPDAALVPEFKALSLRLQPKEVGLVKTRYGWHVIQRVQ